MRKSIRKQSLMLHQLEPFFSKLRAVPDIAMRPNGGWVGTVREALGMTLSQLAQRMGVHQTRVSRIEHDEVLGSTTLSTLESVANAMDCDLVYVILPREPIASELEKRAHKIADKILNDVIENMALENQKPNAQAIEQERQRIIQELLAGNHKHLWEE